MSLQLHRPDERGRLVPHPEETDDWRTQLRSPRWGGALRGGKLPKLGNPEMRPTSNVLSVLFWASLAVATFVVIVVGYTLGVWRFAG
jgi:hypothetical protein